VLEYYKTLSDFAVGVKANTKSNATSCTIPNSSAKPRATIKLEKDDNVVLPANGLRNGNQNNGDLNSCKDAGKPTDAPNMTPTINSDRQNTPIVLPSKRKLEVPSFDDDDY
jgi:hypothetical protein